MNGDVEDVSEGIIAFVPFEWRCRILKRKS